MKVEALQNAIVDGDGVVDFADPDRSFERFGYVSGVLEGKWFDSQERIAQELDDDADRKNTYAQIGIGTAVALTTAATFGTASGGWAALGVGVDVAAAGSISLLSPEFWESDRVDQVKEQREAALNDRSSDLQTQGRLAYLSATGEPIEVKTKTKRNTETITVSVETSEVVDPVTGVVSEQSEFVFTDEDGNSWDPETAEHPLNWEQVDSGMNGEAVANGWNADTSSAEGQGYDDATGKTSGSGDGDGVGPGEVNAVAEYLGV